MAAQATLNAALNACQPSGMGSLKWLRCCAQGRRSVVQSAASTISAPPTQPVMLKDSLSQSTASSAPKAGSLLLGKATRLGALCFKAQFCTQKANRMQPSTK